MKAETSAGRYGDGTKVLGPVQWIWAFVEHNHVDRSQLPFVEHNINNVCRQK